MAETIIFSKKTIEQLKETDKRVEYKDYRLPELRLRVSSTGRKTFCIIKRLSHGKVTRVTLGAYPALSVDKAKSIAMQKLGMIAEGVNPNEEHRQQKVELTMLKEALEDYLSFKRLKTKTEYSYRNICKNHLPKLLDMPLKNISRDQVAKSFNKIESHGQANYAMRILRAVFNFARGEYLNAEGLPIFIDNPVEVISHRKSWHKVLPRQTHLRQSDLPLFFEALDKVKAAETVTGKSICDAMRFALLTGLRRNEVFNLEWSDIKRDYFTIRDTKNGIPLELPLTHYLIAILIQCEERSISKYVFGAENARGKIIEPKKVVKKVLQESGRSCHFHDLRRTFATTAEHMDIGTYKIKRLMNHSTDRNDVTAGYIVLTAETLRDAANKIQERIIDLSQMKIPINDDLPLYMQSAWR